MTASNSLLVGALLVAFPAIALADSTPVATPTEEQVQAARVPYREARELHRQGKLKEALERALEAYRIASTPVTAVEAGHLLVEAGRLVEARDVVRSVAQFPVSPRESEKGREARQEATALGSTLDARIPKVAFGGRPTGVDVSLDGKPVATTDATSWLGLDPGAHAIAVRAGDHTCTTINVTLTEGEARTIDLHEVASTCRTDAALTPSPESVQPPSPPAPPVQSPPTRTLAPPSTTEPPRHASAGAGWRIAGAFIAGAGAVAVGVGGAVALVAKGNYDSVAGDCPPQGCTQHGFDVRTSARSQADVATAVMAIGGAAIGGGVLMLVLAPTSKSADARSPSPRTIGLGVGPGSVQLSWQFQ